MTLLDFLAEIPNGHNSYTVTYGSEEDMDFGEDNLREGKYLIGVGFRKSSMLNMSGATVHIKVVDFIFLPFSKIYHVKVAGCRMTTF